MNKTPELDVVIVNYNSGHTLEKCINQLITEAETALNISVVDNDSNDGSTLFLDALNYPIKTIKNNTNLGYAVACNQAAKTGKAEHLAFINPDCFVNNQQLSHLSSQLRNHQQAALIGCRVLNEDGHLQAASRRRLPTFWRIFWHLTGLSKWSIFKGINIPDSGEFDSVQTVEAVNGACVLVKREAFEQLNGFDESYPLHFEDLDLFAGLQATNHTILYDASVSVVHLKGHSTQDSEQIKQWKQQGLLLYLAKHRPQWEYLMAKFCLSLR